MKKKAFANWNYFSGISAESPEIKSRASLSWPASARCSLNTKPWYSIAPYTVSRYLGAKVPPSPQRRMKDGICIFLYVVWFIIAFRGLSKYRASIMVSRIRAQAHLPANVSVWMSDGMNGWMNNNIAYTAINREMFVHFNGQWQPLHQESQLPISP